MQKENFFRETIKRIKSETPEYFRKIKKISIWITTTATGLVGAKILIPGFILPSKIEIVCSYVIVAGIIAGLISTTAKKCDCQKD